MTAVVCGATCRSLPSANDRYRRLLSRLCGASLIYKQLARLQHNSRAPTGLMSGGWTLPSHVVGVAPRRDVGWCRAPRPMRFPGTVPSTLDPARSALLSKEVLFYATDSSPSRRTTSSSSSVRRRPSDTNVLSRLARRSLLPPPPPCSPLNTLGCE